MRQSRGLSAGAPGPDQRRKDPLLLPQKTLPYSSLSLRDCPRPQDRTPSAAQPGTSLPSPLRPAGSLRRPPLAAAPHTHPRQRTTARFGCVDKVRPPRSRLAGVDRTGNRTPLPPEGQDLAGTPTCAHPSASSQPSRQIHVQSERATLWGGVAC